jgi:hypothetical protein
MIPVDQRIGVKAVRRALKTAGLWEEMKARVREEGIPAITLASTTAEIHERANVANALVNLGKEIHEPVQTNPVPERLRDKPLVEEISAEIEQREIIVERGERAIGTAQSRWNSQSYEATELRPPLKTNAVMRKRRGEQQGQEGERREAQAWTTRTLVAEELANSAKKSRYTPSVDGGVVTRKRRPAEQEQRMKGWLPLKEDGQGFVGIEVRESLTRGGGVGHADSSRSAQKDDPQTNNAYRAIRKKDPE